MGSTPAMRHRDLYRQLRREGKTHDEIMSSMPSESFRKMFIKDLEGGDKVIKSIEFKNTLIIYSFALMIVVMIIAYILKNGV